MADARSIGCVAARRNVVDLQGNDVTTTQLTVDSKVEQRPITNPSFDLKLCSDGLDVLGAKWQLRANDLPLAPGSGFRDGRDGARDSGHVDLLS